MVAIGLADPGCSAIVPFGILGLVVRSAGPTPKGNWLSPFATIVCSPRVRSRTTRSIPYPPRSSRRLVWKTRNGLHIHDCWLAVVVLQMGDAYDPCRACEATGSHRIALIIRC